MNHLILSLLFFAQNLPNGIRIAELPSQGESIEIVVGYEAGFPLSLPHSEGLRVLALNSYAAGGEFNQLQDVDRAGFRLRIPQWALPMMQDGLVQFFRETPAVSDAAARPAGDFRSRVEAEIRAVLLGSGSESPDFSTERAFMMISGSVPFELERALASIPRRASRRSDDTELPRLAAERTFRFSSDQPVGGVVFASPVPGVYYSEWYSVLVLDRLIHRVYPMEVMSSLPLTLRSHYYRLEVPVPPGQLPESVQDNLMQEIQRMQFVRATPEELEAAKADAREYLAGRHVRQWFESYGVSNRLEEGLQGIEAMSADDIRATIRDLLISNRVIAMWAPRVEQLTVVVEDLNDSSSPPPPSVPDEEPAAPVEVRPLPAAPFPLHSHPEHTGGAAERLSSGVSIAASSGYGVFVSGAGLTRFPAAPSAEAMRQFEVYRADRILVLAPGGSLSGVRQLWSGFRGNSQDNAVVFPRGTVATRDLLPLLVLKAMLDRRIIEAGWWHEVALRIDAGYGAALLIDADPARKSRILEWMEEIGKLTLSDEAIAWGREVAAHHFGQTLLELQSVFWERDPASVVQDVQTVPPEHVLDVSRIYVSIF